MFAAFLAAFAIPVPAWDDVGHKITAYIAWQRMTPDVREKVIKILREAPEDSQLSAFYQPYGSQTEASRKLAFFMTSATWPDIIRDRDFATRYKKYHHSNWHYSDTFWTSKDGKFELVPEPEETATRSKNWSNSTSLFEAMVRTNKRRSPLAGSNT